MKTQQLSDEPRPFSLTLYLLMVFALSAPLQISYAVWGALGTTAGYLLRSLSMVMVTISKFLVLADSVGK